MIVFFLKKIYFRVLNFIIKWVKNSSYYKLDILPDTVLRSRLWDFLDTVHARNLSDNVTNIRKSLLGDRIRLIQTIEQLPPEQLDFGLVTSSDDVKLTTVRLVIYAHYHNFKFMYFISDKIRQYLLYKDFDSISS